MINLLINLLINLSIFYLMNFWIHFSLFRYLLWPKCDVERIKVHWKLKSHNSNYSNMYFMSPIIMKSILLRIRIKSTFYLPNNLLRPKYCNLLKAEHFVWFMRNLSTNRQFRIIHFSTSKCFVCQINTFLWPGHLNTSEKCHPACLFTK